MTETVVSTAQVCRVGLFFVLVCFVCISPLYANSCVVPFAEAMTCGVWAELEEVQDPELPWLAKLLPSTVLGSPADSTVAKYVYAFQ